MNVKTGLCHLLFFLACKYDNFDSEDIYRHHCTYDRALKYVYLIVEYLNTICNDVWTLLLFFFCFLLLSLYLDKVGSSCGLRVHVFRFCLNFIVRQHFVRRYLKASDLLLSQIPLCINTFILINSSLYTNINTTGVLACFAVLFFPFPYTQPHTSFATDISVK